MPRRSTRSSTQATSAAEPSSEGGRRTRGSLKTAGKGQEKEPEPEEQELKIEQESTSRGRSSRRGQGDATVSKKAASPSPSPARGRRGKAAELKEEKPTRTSGRARKPTQAVIEAEPEDDEEEEAEIEEEEEESPVPTKKRGGRKAPAKKGKGRQAKKSPKKTKATRKRKSKDVDEDDDEEEDWEEEMAKDLAEKETKEEETEEAVPIEESPRSGRSRRSTRGSPQKPPAESPTARKSPRGASRKASEAIEAIAKNEEVEGTPERESATPDKESEEKPEQVSTEEPKLETVEKSEPNESEKMEEDQESKATEKVELKDESEQMESKDETETLDTEQSASQEDPVVEQVPLEPEKVQEMEQEPPESEAASVEPSEPESKKRKREEDETDFSDQKKAKTDQPESESLPVEEPLIIPEKAVLCGEGDNTEQTNTDRDTEEAMEQDEGPSTEENKVESEVPIPTEEKAAEEKMEEQEEEITEEPEKSTQAENAAEEQEKQPVEVQMQKQEDVQKQETSSASPEKQGSATELSDYVVVDMKDVPDSQSSEVIQSIPKEPPVESNTNSAEEHSSISEENCAAIPTESSQQDSAPAEMDTKQNGEDPKQVVNDNEQSKVNSNDTATINEVDPLVSRHCKMNTNFTGNFITGMPFTIVTYNILADCHARRSPESYQFVPAEYMDMNYRHKRILQEIQYLNSDIVCMQEVDPDYYELKLKPSLDLLGYNSVYKKRLDAFHHEGEATFYKTSRFDLVQTSSYGLKDLALKELSHANLSEETTAAVSAFLESAAVFLVTKFQCKHSQRLLTVGNIHVDYANFSNPSLQSVQVASAIRELVSVAGGPNHPHVIVGDFNTWPGSPVYQLTKEGYLNDQSMSELQAQECVTLQDGQKQSLVNVWWKGFQHTSSTLKSAYQTILESDPVTSQHPHKEARALDYVWFSSDSIDVVNVLETNPVEVLLKPAGGIPSIHFPSDHLSLKAQLAFK